MTGCRGQCLVALSSEEELRISLHVFCFCCGYKIHCVCRNVELIVEPHVRLDVVN